MRVINGLAGSAFFGPLTIFSVLDCDMSESANIGGEYAALARGASFRTSGRGGCVIELVGTAERLRGPGSGLDARPRSLSEGSETLLDDFL